jgi:hypothetical protein
VADQKHPHPFNKRVGKRLRNTKIQPRIPSLRVVPFLLRYSPCKPAHRSWDSRYFTQPIIALNPRTSLTPCVQAVKLSQSVHSSAPHPLRARACKLNSDYTCSGPESGKDSLVVALPSTPTLCYAVTLVGGGRDGCTLVSRMYPSLPAPSAHHFKKGIWYKRLCIIVLT